MTVSMQILDTLRANPKGMTARELGVAMDIPWQHLSSVLSKSFNYGFLTKCGRRKFISITGARRTASIYFAKPHPMRVERGFSESDWVR